MEFKVSLLELLDGLSVLAAFKRWKQALHLGAATVKGAYYKHSARITGELPGGRHLDGGPDLHQVGEEFLVGCLVPDHGDRKGLHELVKVVALYKSPFTLFDFDESFGLKVLEGFADTPAACSELGGKGVLAWKILTGFVFLVENHFLELVGDHCRFGF